MVSVDVIQKNTLIYQFNTVYEGFVCIDVFMNGAGVMVIMFHNLFTFRAALQGQQQFCSACT